MVCSDLTSPGGSCRSIRVAGRSSVFPCCGTIAELPFGLDAALLAIPAKAVPGVIRQLAGRGVAGAVVLANGFGETAAGAPLDADLKAAIAESGVRVVGPNTSGLLTVASGANLVGVADVPAGPVALVTQSGNMLLTFLADVRANRMPGLHSYIGLGNQADVGFADCVRELAARSDVGVIALHAEGFKEGRSLLIAAAQAARRAARCAAARRALHSWRAHCPVAHGVRRGPDGRRARGCSRRRGSNWSNGPTSSPSWPVCSPRRRRSPTALGIAVLSDGGGHASLTVDALADRDVPLANLAAATRDRLAELLGPAAAVANPIDVAGATDADPSPFVESPAC
jgi:acetyltransferase